VQDVAARRESLLRRLFKQSETHLKESLLKQQVRCWIGVVFCASPTCCRVNQWSRRVAVCT
jgi:hypothetical protein